MQKTYFVQAKDEEEADDKARNGEGLNEHYSSYEYEDHIETVNLDEEFENNENKYVVRVNITYTKKYYVVAESEQEARETYLLEGTTSILNETERDREVISVLTMEEDSKYVG